MTMLFYIKQYEKPFGTSEIVFTGFSMALHMSQLHALNLFDEKYSWKKQLSH